MAIVGYIDGYIDDNNNEYELADNTSRANITAIKDGQGIDSFADVEMALANKVDKVTGKGLSTNDYTNADKAIVDGVTSALNGKQDTISDLATIRSGATAGSTAYQKPSGGIPKSDLASAVQTSLGKADSAIQDISGKQDVLTFDNTPTANSNNPVKSGGVKSAVDAIQNQLNAQGVLGAKNLLPNTATSRTVNGVTFTVNADKSVTASGTASGGNASLYILPTTTGAQLKARWGANTQLKFTGCPQNGGAYTYYLRLQRHSPSWAVMADDRGDGTEFNTNLLEDTATYSIIVNVNDGNTANYTFKPMLCLASDPDSTYVPYAMTNRELTEKAADIESNVTAKTNDLYSNIGILSTPVPSYVANTLPVLKRNITSAFYNGSLRGEIAAGNFKNVRAGDYIIGQATGSTYYVAMCDYRLGKGDNTNNSLYPAYGTHHLGLMLFKPVGTTALWKGYGNQDKSWRVSAADLGRCPWNAATDADPTNTEAIGSNNTNITRQYNGANVSGYMGSFIRERIDAILLPQCFQADFGSANVLKYREIHGNGVDTTKASGAHPAWTGLTSGWTWYDRYIDLPSEVELYGSRIWSSSGFDVGCQCEQLPLFRNAAIHDFYPRIDIWTKAVADSSIAAYRNNFGIASGSIASNAVWACPLVCVK